MISTPNAASLRKRLYTLVGKPPINQIKLLFYESNPFVAHIKKYTLSEVIKVVQWSKLNTIYSKCLDHLYYTRWAETDKILKRLLLQFYKLLNSLKNDLKDTIVVIEKKPYHNE